MRVTTGSTDVPTPELLLEPRGSTKGWHTALKKLLAKASARAHSHIISQAIVCEVDRRCRR